MKLSELKPLEKNPFKSKGDEQIKLISKSITDFEKMMSIRKIVIDENNEILGGNKRFFALKMLNYTEVPDDWIDKRTDLTEEEKKRFIVSDNAHYGSTWDFDILEEWGATEEWGVELSKFESDEEQKDLSGDLKETFEVIISCNDEKHQEQVYNKMIADGFNVRVLTL